MSEWLGVVHNVDYTTNRRTYSDIAKKFVSVYPRMGTHAEVQAKILLHELFKDDVAYDHDMMVRAITVCRLNIKQEKIEKKFSRHEWGD